MSIDGGAPPRARARDGLATFLVVPLSVLLVALIAIMYVLYRPVRVDGPSMLPGLRSEDRVLVRPGYDDPRRGDVVVVVDHPDRGEDLVKRVVGIPGDTIEIRDDVAYVNGSAEAYRFPVTLVAGTRSYRLPQVTVASGTVFLMGDNRPVSLDSRDFGAVPVSDVMGRVVAIFLPPQRFGALDYGSP